MIIICIILIILTIVLLLRNINLNKKLDFLIEILMVLSKVPIPIDCAEEVSKDVERIQDEYGIHIIKLKEKE